MQDNETPLLKKSNKKIVLVSDDDSSVDSIPTKPATPIKKPRSEAQINAFKKTQENRKKNIELNKENKKVEAAKLLLNHKPIKPEIKPVESESEEEEVIIVEKRKKKSKPKRIIVEESSSEEDEPPIPIQKVFKSQQNKRSININAVQPVPSTTVFFV